MLANHSNGHTGQCNPRLKTLAEECEMRPETLRGHIKHLEELGFVETVPQFFEGVQLPNQYVLKHGGTSENRRGGGGENRRGGTSENRPPIKQEVKQEDKPIERALRATPQKPDAVNEQTWADWVALRKAKKAPVTYTVVNQATKEAAKAGIALEEFFQIWCARGSQGLQADWIKPNEIKQRCITSFAEQATIEKQRRWEAMTGKQWPGKSTQKATLIEVERLA